MEGIIVRRVIPSDNSCLFNAVGYVMDHDKNKAPELRQVIVATVASDPVKYSKVFLGKPNNEYCSWIQDSEKWGRAIELAILADYYGCEIAAYDIQTTRCNLYGQMSPFEGAPEEFHQNIFAVGKDRTLGPAEELALNLLKEQQRWSLTEKELHLHCQVHFALWSMPNRGGGPEGGCGARSSNRPC
ncbi:OVARIAN TUMOR DOMAIN-containing deubiquitinating enzyme 2-like isoform X2 [Mangifera indica]|uniref:OVARIAN TUMOR DOMAIN-containing deubiquitinating enzyme 2-like isoform X2 n=1 Tax=Mangifera indica TaxID=29780 RepID=UPI001CFB6FB6|nr:OVARIAN TUMOR DOMAIN-containing deubiquitinating enzyme 2-like isoform X2 [Mangifera indica]